MRNPYRALLALLPTSPLQVGTVQSLTAGTATIELVDGGVIAARGSAGVGDRVFVRDGAIEGTAPTLPIEVIEI
ncbi:hypothetical protein [Ideonella sp.]|uniref:hypothetical protein n=1 Tax=Ideonella sp. TaxID=1929293 RepID=UPI003BB607C6